MQDEYCLRVLCLQKCSMMSPAPLKNPLHFKGFPDNLQAIRNIVFLLMNETHALSLACPAWSRLVAVSLAHLVSGAPAVYGWIGRREQSLCPLLSPSLSCASNEQSN